MSGPQILEYFNWRVHYHLLNQSYADGAEGQEVDNVEPVKRGSWQWRLITYIFFRPYTCHVSDSAPFMSLIFRNVSLSCKLIIIVYAGGYLFVDIMSCSFYRNDHLVLEIRFASMIVDRTEHIPTMSFIDIFGLYHYLYMCSNIHSCEDIRLNIMMKYAYSFTYTFVGHA